MLMLVDHLNIGSHILNDEDPCIITDMKLLLTRFNREGSRKIIQKFEIISESLLTNKIYKHESYGFDKLFKIEITKEKYFPLDIKDGFLDLMDEYGNMSKIPLNRIKNYNGEITEEFLDSSEYYINLFSYDGINFYIEKVYQ